MKTLRLVLFNPQQNAATRYWEEDGFRRNDELQISSLPLDQQAVVAGALAWASSQLPEGFTSLKSAELRKEPDVVSAWSTPGSPDEQPVPAAYSPAFSAGLVGSGPLGERAVEIASVPGPVTDSMAALWGQLSA